MKEKKQAVYICRIYEKSATNGLHFFVRYAIMYHSDAQMSLLKEH